MALLNIFLYGLEVLATMVDFGMTTFGNTSTDHTDIKKLAYV